MAITRGTQLFFFFFFFVCRDVRVGSLKWPGALVFRGRYRPRNVKRLSNHTVSTYFPDGYTNPIRLFQSRFVHHNLLGGGDFDFDRRAIPPVNVQETDNSLCPWSFVMTLANPTMHV